MVPTLWTQVTVRPVAPGFYAEVKELDTFWQEKGVVSSLLLIKTYSSKKIARELFNIWSSLLSECKLFK